MKLSKNLIEKLNAEQRKDLEAFELYLLEQEKAENTIYAHLFSVASFMLFSGDLSKVELIKFKKYLMDKYKPETVNLRISGLNNFLIFKGKGEYKLSILKSAKKPFTDGIITTAEYQQLINFTKFKNLKLYFIIKFLAMTGARISELIRFTKQDLERGYAEMHTKGKHRRINIPKSLREECAGFFEEHSHYLFINKYGSRLTERGVAALLKDYAERAGVNKEVVHPHNFRHFFAIQFLKNNSNIALLADLLGHSNVNITALYLRMSREQQRKELDEAVNW